MTLDAVLHQKPTPPHDLNPKIPIELQGIIGKAMEKDRKHRYQSAAEMRSDLAQLKREAESGTVKSRAVIRRMLRAASKTFSRNSRFQTYLVIGMAALLVTVLGAVGAWWFKHREVANAEQKNAIAVLPLQNLNGDYSIDYLRFALGRRAVQRADLLAFAGGAALVGHAKICGVRSGSEKSGAGIARGATAARSLHQAGRPVDGNAGGDRRADRPPAVADHRHARRPMT